MLRVIFLENILTRVQALLALSSSGLLGQSLDIQVETESRSVCDFPEAIIRRDVNFSHRVERNLVHFGLFC